MNRQILVSEFRVFPRTGGRSPVPAGVPEEIAKDYLAAATISNDSPEAAAAMARRCLQQLIRTTAKIREKTLYAEIDALVKSNTLPPYLTTDLDALRQLGNFGAHPEWFETTGELVEVEQGEVEWMLDVLDSLFDFYFVMPAKANERKAALNAKLAATGKAQLP